MVIILFVFKVGRNDDLTFLGTDCAVYFTLLDARKTNMAADRESSE